jgi:GAF domain-containing protein
VGAFQAPSGALYQREEGGLPLAYTHGTWDNAAAGISVLLQNGDTQLGILFLGLRQHERGYTERERATLEAVTAVVVAAIARSHPGIAHLDS